MSEKDPSQTTKPRVVCCIGDIHGFDTKLRNLWSNLESQIGDPAFQTATVIFLGDYCDRGPNTRQVLDFLVSLPSKYPHQKHVFLSGNHDLAFAAFLLAKIKSLGAKLLKPYKFMRQMYLVKAVPDEHKKFLADMVWVHEEDDICIETEDGIKHCRLIAVHAGLERDKDVKEQLKLLKDRDTRIPKVEALSGRKNVWDIPKELRQTPTILVSGHHAKLHVEGLRLVIDEGGGYAHKPVAAIVLPSMKIVRDTDDLSK
ncbi:hypothetical protein L484_013787 [Morus notabilis]|uniref:Calcineurin-like phosphoesterase domain-containing protein n=1 Tax=Morus notabilis TaxID=981085 RepID=W9QSX9_9ROSA|nr:hypothetical protein L484_013787 [Morus notabilis]